MVQTTIVGAGTADLETVRRLFCEYARSLPFDLEFQGFAEELARLPEPYTPPRGCLLLALTGGLAVGVVALKPLAAGIAEIKRLYVVSAARGHHVGQMLVEASIGRSIGKRLPASAARHASREHGRGDDALPPARICRDRAVWAEPRWRLCILRETAE